MRLATVGLIAGIALSMSACATDPVIEREDPVDKWHEDTLPQEMYDWVDSYGADLVHLKGNTSMTRHGHPNCWEAVADTTLVMCPDGYRSES